MSNLLRFIFIGDLVGEPGIRMLQKWAPRLRQEYKADGLIVNGENSAKNGMGIAAKDFIAIKACGVDVVTTGNHAFDQKDIGQTFQDRADFIRPANYPAECPGRGYSLFSVDGQKTVAVINLHGRVFSKDLLSCPFRTIDSLLLMLKERTNIIFIDFHGDASSEKKAMALYLDGRVSGIYGTHTHAQTADAYVLPKGTSYITDLGYGGALNSVLGMELDAAVKKMMIHHKAGKFVVATTGPYVLSGVFVTIDRQTGKSCSIAPIRIIDTDLAA